MIKKILTFLLILLIFLGVGYYLLYTQGFFQTKESIYSEKTASAMKCEAGKCGAQKCGFSVEKDTK